MHVLMYNNLTDMISLEEEVARLRKKRGLDCRCRGSCQVHLRTISEFSNHVSSKLVFNFLNFSVSLPAPLRRKRKIFDQLSVYGKRKGLGDVRSLLKIKEAQYQTPVSQLAGFVIQEVIYSMTRSHFSASFLIFSFK